MSRSSSDVLLHDNTILDSRSGGSSSNYTSSDCTVVALVILNNITSTGSEEDNALFHTLWNKASVRICADGGANRLYDSLCTPHSPDSYIPQYIAVRFLFQFLSSPTPTKRC